MSGSDLLADLQNDRRTPSGAARLPAEPPRRGPAFELRVTPLQWSLPRLERSGRGWAGIAGPVRAALLR